MAKDPAFLFYPGDWLGGTMHLDWECKGAYLDLLMMQFQRDHISIHMIQHMLGHKYEHIWPKIADKFKTDGTHFWNERLKVEKEKRQNYSNSRKMNRTSKHVNKHINEHMSSHMENRNENENRNTNTEGVQGEILPGAIVWEDELYREHLERIAKAHRVTDVKLLLDMWEGWYVNKFEWRKKDLQEMRLSFETWIKHPKSRENYDSTKRTSRTITSNSYGKDYATQL